MPGGVIAQDDTKKALFLTESAQLARGITLAPGYADSHCLACLRGKKYESPGITITLPAQPD